MRIQNYLSQILTTLIITFAVSATYADSLPPAEAEAIWNKIKGLSDKEMADYFKSQGLPEADAECFYQNGACRKGVELEFANRTAQKQAIDALTGQGISKSDYELMKAMWDRIKDKSDAFILQIFEAAGLSNKEALLLCQTGECRSWAEKTFGDSTSGNGKLKMQTSSDLGTNSVYSAEKFVAPSGTSTNAPSGVSKDLLAPQAR